MKEATLRKYHRYTGGTFAVFIILQAVSGILLSIEHITGNHSEANPARLLHTWDGGPGSIYRILLGCGILFMAVTGSWILIKIRARSRQASKKTQ